VLFVGNIANHPLVADNTALTITNQPLSAFQKFFHKNNSIFCAAENGSQRHGAIVLFFVAVGRKHENLRLNTTVTRQNSSLDRRHEILAQKDIFFHVPRMGVQPSARNHFLAHEKGEIVEIVLLAGGKTIAAGCHKNVRTIVGKLLKLYPKFTSFDLFPKSGVIFWT